MYEYFPDNYGWSLSVLMALGMGIPFSDLDDICRPLRSQATLGPAADLEWMRSFVAGADRYIHAAVADEAGNRHGLAGLRTLRAAACLLLAERQVTTKTQDTLAVYRRGIETFRRGINLRHAPVEFVEVPYGDTSLPALFLPAHTSSDPRSAPCVVHFDGLDVMKELIYLFGVSKLPEFGVSVLICDHPGVGEARRLRGLPLSHEVEQPAAACVDYLETRGEVDPDRIGMMALSLGGYYSPRAAAFEPRFRCCVAWGGCWDAVAVDRFQRGEGEASVNLGEQFTWIFDTDSDSAAAELEHFRLETIMDRISCPVLVVHGEDDRQVPIWAAENTYNAATNASRRDLKIFTITEGGSAHCQLDDLEAGTEYMFEWIADVLGGNPRDLAASGALEDKGIRSAAS